MATHHPKNFPIPALAILALEISNHLRRTGEKVALVETACGGLLSSTFLSMPGASRLYAGGLTLYTLPSRIAFADWTASHIQNYSGPTPAICEGLASSARARLCNTDLQDGVTGEDEGKLWVLAESGTAGPTASGDGSNRQPGYVALAVVGPRGQCMSREVNTGIADRSDNMIEFGILALNLLLEALKVDDGSKI